jgi:hypothetical protein
VSQSNENTPNESNAPYFVDIFLPSGQEETISFSQKLSIGGSEEADIVFKDFELKEIHCILKYQNDLISINNFGEKGTTLLNEFSLLPGKMYILDHGDEISLGEIKFFIKRNEHFRQDKKVQFDSLPPSSEEEEEDIGDEYYYEEEEEVKENNFLGMKKRTEQTRSLNIAQKEISGELNPYFHTDNGPFGFKGFFIRLICLVASFSLAYIFSYLIFPFFSINKVIYSLLTPLSPYFENLKTFLNVAPFFQDLSPLFKDFIFFHLSIESAYYIFIFVFLDILFNLIFHVPLPYFLLGIRSSEYSKFKIFKAPFRSIIGLITFPFLIFDFPILFKKRSFKEWVTATTFNYSADSIKILGLGLIIPVLILISLISPFFSPPVQLEGLTFYKKKSRSLASKNEKVLLHSTYFGLKFYQPLPDNFKIFPSIFKKGKKIIKKMTVYDSKTKMVIGISIKKEFKLKPILKKSIVGSPFFPTVYPEIYHYLQSDKRNYKMTTELKKEWQNFVENSLKLSLFHYPTQMFSIGLMPNAHLSFRKNLFKILKVRNNSEAQSTRMGHSKVIILSPIQRVQRNSIYILPSDNLTPSVLEISFNSKSKKLAEKFLHKSLLRKIDWDSSLQKNAPFKILSPKAKSSKPAWNAFAVLDAFYDLEKKILVDYEMISGIYKYYEKLSKNKNRFTDPKFNRLYKSSLREAITVIKIKQKKLQTRPLNELLRKLENIISL